MASTIKSYAYHTTQVKYLTSIAKSGLRPDIQLHELWFTDTLNGYKPSIQHNEAILRFPWPDDAKFIHDPDDINEFITRTIIPSEQLDIQLKNNKWVPLIRWLKNHKKFPPIRQEKVIEAAEKNIPTLKEAFFLNEEISSSTRKTIETLEPNDILTVYHGAPLFRIGELINGFDASVPHRRDYRAGTHPGLFVTADFDEAKSFGGGIVLEIEVRAKFIHGTNYGGNIGREQEKAGENLGWLKRQYPESFRPYMAYTMLQKVEPQGLLRGIVKPSQIKKVFKRNLNTKNWDEYTRKEFLDANFSINRDMAGKDVYISDAGIDLSNPNMSLKDFLAFAAMEQKYDESKILNYLLTKGKHDPKGLEEVLADWTFGKNSHLGARTINNIFNQIKNLINKSEND